MMVPDALPSSETLTSSLPMMSLGHFQSGPAEEIPLSLPSCFILDRLNSACHGPPLQKDRKDIQPELYILMKAHGSLRMGDAVIMMWIVSRREVVL